MAEGPALVAVEQDSSALEDVERELRERYDLHYRVICMGSSEEALTCLKDLAAAGDDVAVVLAGHRLSGMTGSELLAEVRHLHPHAKRGLLIPWGGWGDPATGEAIFDSIASGRIDHYVLRPSTPPNELFHQVISSLLLDWAESQSIHPYTIQVVGESWSGRAYELRDVLGRCAMPHSFCLADSDRGRELLARFDEKKKLPLMILPNGRALENPTNSEVAHSAGSPLDIDGSEFDLVIVGGGPAGLSAAVYGASEGFSTLVVDGGGIGGQATYSSLIRNYLGFPRGISGRRLAQQAYEQAWVFGAKFSLMQRATDVGRENGGLVVSLPERGRVHARAVILATGASYRRLGVPALEELTGAGVYYGGTASEASTLDDEDKHVYVLGGANSAGQAALHLARYAPHVTLLVRAQSLGAGMSHYLVQELEGAPNVRVRLQTEIVGGGGESKLEHLVLRDRAAGTEETVEAQELFVMIGARPHTDWLPPEIERDRRGFVLTGPDLRDDGPWPLDRGPFALETSMPGVFAAGDARHGSVKRVASAVGEGSVAIQQLHQLFATDRLHPRGRPKEPAVVAGQ